MNRQISRLGGALLLAYFVLFAQLNRIQFFDAEEHEMNPVNTRVLVDDFGAPRGQILAAGGTVLARSTELEDGPFDRRREYPLGELFAEVTGFFSFDAGADGLESSWDDELRGDQNSLTDGLRELLGGESTTADVHTTLLVELQEAARDALGDRAGSVVVVDAQSGALEALWSWPTYDPNPLASVDADEARMARQQLLADPANPLLPRTVRELFFPGSTFKVVTAAAALENGLATLDDPVFPEVVGYTPPLTTNELSNFGGNSCGGPLRDLIRRSCNAGMAQLAVQLVGPEALIETAEGFGFNDIPPVGLPRVVASVMPTDFGENLGVDVEIDPAIAEQVDGRVPPIELTDDMPALAQTAVGQFEVKATPLQMALVAATIANDGVVPNPHVVRAVVDADGSVLHEADLEQWGRAIGALTAEALREAMVSAVVSGTAQRLAIDGLIIGAKTGTAQLDSDAESTHAWVIAFAGDSIDRPAMAIAVLVEADDELGEQTGGRVAAPVAKAVIEAWNVAR
ncbi:MAG: penicillin-binding transpeptidase domain-containing protein [Acidimicrobiales bacterium]